MFPISGEALSILCIARYWSREIHPTVSAEELRLRLEQAWWRGELVGDGDPDRSGALHLLYSTCQDCIAFALPGEEEPVRTMEDDGSLVVIRPVRVPLPGPDPRAWTESECSRAFEAIADGWDLMPEQAKHAVGPIIAGIEISRDEFRRWIASHSFRRPKFWGDLRRQRSARRTSIVRRVSQTKVDAVIKAAIGRITARTPGAYISLRRVTQDPEVQKLDISRPTLTKALDKYRRPEVGRPKKKSP